MESGCRQQPLTRQPQSAPYQDQLFGGVILQVDQPRAELLGLTEALLELLGETDPED